MSEIPREAPNLYTLAGMCFPFYTAKNNYLSSVSRGSRVRVTSDIIFPGNRAQIIAADIGEAPPRAQSVAHHRHKAARTKVSPQVFVEPKRLSNAALKATLRRLSKMVLAGYGGPTLLFFGVPLTPAGSLPAGSPQARSEEAQLARAINASEAEASGDLSEREVPSPLPDSYSWWGCNARKTRPRHLLTICKVSPMSSSKRM